MIERFSVVLACTLAAVLAPDPLHAQSTFVIRDVRVFDGERLPNDGPCS